MIPDAADGPGWPVDSASSWGLRCWQWWSLAFAGEDVRIPYTRKIFHFGSLQRRGRVSTRRGGSGGTNSYGAAVAGAGTWWHWSPEGRETACLRSAGQGDGPADGVASLCSFLSWRQPWAAWAPLCGLGSYAAVGYLVAGWGDAVGEPVGTRFGRHPYRVPFTRRRARGPHASKGSMAVFVCAWARRGPRALSFGRDRALRWWASASLCALGSGRSWRP